MLNIGPQELLLILVIALIVVGPTRLPELGRSIGKGLREIRKAQDEVKRTIQVNLDEPASAAGPAKTKPTPAAAPDVSAEATAEATPDSVNPGVPPAVGPDPVPQAAEPLAASEIREVSRTLGQSLAELRRAREEIQRTFRVDLSDTSDSRPPRRDGAGGTPPADETPTG